MTKNLIDTTAARALAWFETTVAVCAGGAMAAHSPNTDGAATARSTAPYAASELPRITR